MAAENKKISELPSGGSLQVSDWFGVRRGTENYYITGQMILDAANVDLTSINNSIGNLESSRLKLDASNGPMTGNLDMGSNKITSSSTPTNDEDLANKEYVDKFLPLFGGTMSGFATLHADPINALHAATKQYVDAQIGLIGAIPLDTNDLDEGSDGTATGAGTELDGNKYYYTNARFDARLTSKSTDDLSEGALNYYFTTSRFNANFAAKDTDNLIEGIGNLYYTNARARLALSGDATINYDNITGIIGVNLAAIPTPAYGISGRIPYMNGSNDGFLYGGGLSFDGTNLALDNFLAFNPGSDIDIDLIRVGVTGTPKISWDESEHSFVVDGGSSSSRGFQYAADYNANFTARSLVDKGYIDGRLADYLPLAGGTMSGDINLNGNKIVDFYDPSFPQKMYFASGGSFFLEDVTNSTSFHFRSSTGTIQSLSTTADVTLDLIGLPTANRTWSFPDASGVVALESWTTAAIATLQGTIYSNFLPLSGGTMTGAINMGTNLIHGTTTNDFLLFSSGYSKFERIDGGNIGNVILIGGGATLTGVNAAYTKGSTVEALPSKLLFTYKDDVSGSSNKMQMYDAAWTIDDSINSQGLVYVADYSANYTNRSLVDKEYVDGLIGGGGSGGVLGISDSSGTYTYYSTFALALASASAGDTIEMFADIEETTSTTVTLIPDITVNGNGHIYKLSVDADTHAFTFNSSGTVFLNNITIIRTGRSVNANGYCLQHNNSGATVKGNGCQLINTYGSGTTGLGSLYGLNITAVLRGVYNPFGAINVYDTNIQCTGASNGNGIYVATGEIVNCYAKIVNGDAIYNGTGRIYNSVGITTNGTGIVCNGEVYESTGKSTSSIGINAQRPTNCVGISTSSAGISCANGKNCVGISTSGIGGQGDFHNSTLISSSNYAFSGTGTKALYNCYVESSSNITTFRPNLYNSTVVCKWNNAGGHCTTSNVLLELEIVNSSFKVANASAYCIDGYGVAGGSTWKYANNSFEGSTTPVNTANISQGIVNTSDSQGNILI